MLHDADVEKVYYSLYMVYDRLGTPYTGYFATYAGADEMSEKCIKNNVCKSYIIHKPLLWYAKSVCTP